MKIREDYNCLLELTHDITRGKWKAIILWQLGKREKYSLASLHKDISGISEKFLLEQLQDWLTYSLIEKQSYAGYPLKVEYCITKRGLRMLEAIAIMQEIGIEILKESGQVELLRELGFIE